MYKSFSAVLPLVLLLSLLAACGSGAVSAASTASAAASSEAAAPAPAASAESALSPETAPLADGVYSADFKTDSSMFGVNEACNGKGTLTVKNGAMTIHVSLVSQKILKLYAGTAADAQKEGAALLEPSVDTVTYSDGTTEEVYGFDIPVPAIGQDFDVALVGTKGTWYDHKVSVQAPAPQESAE